MCEMSHKTGTVFVMTEYLPIVLTKALPLVAQWLDRSLGGKRFDSRRCGAEVLSSSI